MTEHLADSYEIAPDPMSVGIYVISSPGRTVLALVLIGNALIDGLWASFRELYRWAASHVHKILQGANPADSKAKGRAPSCRKAS
jgi:hypothetical protein